jgi:hypothetical protein
LSASNISFPHGARQFVVGDKARGSCQNFEELVPSTARAFSVSSPSPSATMNTKWPLPTRCATLLTKR